MTEASLEVRVRAGLLWSAARTWGGRFSSLLVFLVLARLLNPHQFGVFAIAVAVLAFLELLCDQGLADALVQKRQIEPADLDTAFLLNLATAVLLVAGVWVGAPIFAAWMREPDLTAVLRWSSFGVLFFALGFCQVALLRRDFDYQRLALRTIASTLGGGVVGIALAFAGFGVWSLVAQFLVNTGIGALLLWFGRAGHWRPTWTPRIRNGVEIAHFGMRVLGARVIDFGTQRTMEIAIGYWHGAAVAGLYAVGSRVYFLILQMLGSTALDVALGAFSRIRDDRARLTAAYERAFELSAALALPLFVMIAAVAPELCVSVFGPQWRDSGEVLAWLGLLGAVQVLQAYNRTGLNAVARPDLTLRLQLLAMTATAVTLILCRDAPLGVLVRTYVIAQLLIAPVSFVVARPHLGFSYRRLAALAGPWAIASAAGFGATVWLRPQVTTLTSVPFVQLLLLGTAGMATLAIVMLVLAPGHIARLAQILWRAPATVDVSAGIAVTTPPDAAAAMKVAMRAGPSGVRRAVTGAWAQLRPWRHAPLMYLRWSFDARRQARMAAQDGPRSDRILIVPPSSSAIVGSKGDEAMLIAIIGLLRLQRPNAEIAVLTANRPLPESLAARDVVAERAWAGPTKLQPLVRLLDRYGSLVTIGADVADGGYAPLSALRFWMLADLAARRGLESVVVGFSFNRRPSIFIRPLLRVLHSKVRPCVRDAHSLERFNACSRVPGLGVADIAFALEPRADATEFDAVGAWSRRQHGDGRKVLAFNIHPMLFRADDRATLEQAVAASSEALRQLIEKDRVSVLVVSHDQRAGNIGDDVVLRPIAARLAAQVGDRVHMPQSGLGAPEIKALLQHADVVAAGRMHLAVAALGMGKPVAVIVYQDKFEGLLAHFELPAALLLQPSEALDARRVERWLRDLMEREAALRSTIERRLPEVLRLSRRNLEVLCA